MNKMIVVALGALVVSGTLLAKPQSEAPKGKHIGKVAAAGGILMAPQQQPSILVVNDQDVVPLKVVEETIFEITKVLRLPLAVKKDGIDLSNVKYTITLYRGDGQTPMLVAHENGWAKYDVGALVKDVPDDRLRDQRFTKEFWRTFAYLLGAGHSQMQPSLMGDIRSAKALDSINMLAPYPDALTPITQTAQRVGVKPAKMATYRRACEEGWAPKPENEIQRQIWDKVHEMPTKPLVIEPESKSKK